jgi:hypothetical protein
MERPEAGDLKLCEVLTNPAPFPEYLFGGGSNGGCLGIEAEIGVNAGREIEQSFCERTAGRERLTSVGSEFSARSDSRRFEDELISFETRRREIVRNGCSYVFPCGRLCGPRLGLTHFYFASGLDDQLGVRRLNAEKLFTIPEAVDSLAKGSRRRRHYQPVTQTLMFGKRTRSQVHGVISNGDRSLVAIGGFMNDSVGHPPILIGVVRA